MMLKPLFIDSLSRLGCITLAVVCLLSVNAYCEEAKKINGPIVITSEKLTADNKARTALFEGSVVAKAADTIIYCKRMLVYYAEGTGNVQRIDASGDVKFVKENRVITSQNAVYYADGEKIIFTGEPRAVEDENVVTGSKMTYFMNEDRFFVEGSKVFLTKKKEQ